MAPISRASKVHERAALKATGEALSYVAMLNLTEAFSRAVVEGMRRGTARQVQALGFLFQDETRDPARRTAMFERVGQKAKRSVMGSYGQVVTARRTPAGRTGYRAGQGRQANNALRNALRDNQNYVATPTGLSFMDVEFLDRRAAHWYRLNFGVGQRGRGGQQGRYGVRWNGLVGIALGLETGPSRYPMIIPAGGFFVNKSGKRVQFNASRVGQDRFYPGPGRTGRFGAQQPIVTKGIAARNFLDAGIRRIAREFPVELGFYYQDVFSAFKQGKGPLAKVTNFKVAAPRPLRVKVQVVQRPSRAPAGFPTRLFQ